MKVSPFLLFRMVWLLVCGFMSALSLDAIWLVVTEPEQYAPLWGGEGPAGEFWYYESEKTYLFYNAFWAIWYLCGILVCLFRRMFAKKFVLAHFLLSMAEMLYIYLE